MARPKTRKILNFVCKYCQKEFKKYFRKNRNIFCSHSCAFKYIIHIHHIDYDKKNIKIENLISLCQSCHMKTNYNRKYWRKILKDDKSSK
jgi:5-methylcytosine-specific restriction endonuclease McrA